MALYFIAPKADVPAHFLDDAIHGEIPTGAVKISTNVFRRMLAARSEGREILAGPDGKPKAGPKPVETVAELRADKVAQVKTEAARRINAIAPAWRQANDLRIIFMPARLVGGSDAAARRFAAIDAVRTASNAIEAAIASMPQHQLAKFHIENDPRWPDPMILI